MALLTQMFEIKQSSAYKESCNDLKILCILE